MLKIPTEGPSRFTYLTGYHKVEILDRWTVHNASAPYRIGTSSEVLHEFHPALAESFTLNQVENNQDDLVIASFREGDKATLIKISWFMPGVTPGTTTTYCKYAIIKNAYVMSDSTGSTIDVIK